MNCLTCTNSFDCIRKSLAMFIYPVRYLSGFNIKFRRIWTLPFLFVLHIELQRQNEIMEKRVQCMASYFIIIVKLTRVNNIHPSLCCCCLARCHRCYCPTNFHRCYDYGCDCYGLNRASGDFAGPIHVKTTADWKQSIRFI